MAALNEVETIRRIALAENQFVRREISAHRGICERVQMDRREDPEKGMVGEEQFVGGHNFSSSPADIISRELFMDTRCVPPAVRAARILREAHPFLSACRSLPARGRLLLSDRAGHEIHQADRAVVALENLP